MSATPALSIGLGCMRFSTEAGRDEELAAQTIAAALGARRPARARDPERSVVIGASPAHRTLAGALGARYFAASQSGDHRGAVHR